MSRVLIAQKAQFDIATISDYIATSNAPAAARFINDLFDRFELYATQPSMGKNVPIYPQGFVAFLLGTT